MIAIGFTGTRWGISRPQRAALGEEIRSLFAACGPDTPGWLHHGDCVGADEDAVRAARTCGHHVRVHGHPPDNPAMRAFVKSDAESPPLPYLDRNAVIVGACQALVACPEGPEVIRSGTWSTVRAARKAGRAVIIIMPDGHIIRQP